MSLEAHCIPCDDAESIESSGSERTNGAERHENGDGEVDTHEKKGNEEGVEEERDLHLDADGTRISVESRSGYLCRVTMEILFKLSLSDVMDIFQNPCNASVFRDIQAVSHRALLLDFGEGHSMSEVEQQSQIQLLWFRKTVGVVMHVYADRERGHLEFKLARKGVMRAFHGKWHIRPHEPTEGEVAAWVARNKIEAPPGSSWCLATLQQDVMPAGIPPFMANIPGIRGILRGVCVRAVKRIVEDIRRVELRVARGEKLVDVLRPPNARKVLREGPDDAWVHPPVIDLGLSSVEIQEATERARHATGSVVESVGTGAGAEADKAAEDVQRLTVETEKGEEAGAA